MRPRNKMKGKESDKYILPLVTPLVRATACLILHSLSLVNQMSRRLTFQGWIPLYGGGCNRALVVLPLPSTILLQLPGSWRWKMVCRDGSLDTRHSPHTNAQRSDRLTETINHALASSLGSSRLTNTLRAWGGEWERLANRVASLEIPAQLRAHYPCSGY